MQLNFNKLYSLVLVICMASIALICCLFWIDFEDHSKLPLQEDTLIGYCGTMALPENKVYTIDHPGLKIFKDNCQVCHSLRKGNIVIGPSLYSSIERNNIEIIDQMLQADSLRLIKTDYYKEPRSEYKFGVHLGLHFNFSEMERQQILSFIDTITVMQ